MRFSSARKYLLATRGIYKYTNFPEAASKRLLVEQFSVSNHAGISSNTIGRTALVHDPSACWYISRRNR